MDQATIRKIAKQLFEAEQNLTTIPPLTETYPDITDEDAYKILLAMPGGGEVECGVDTVGDDAQAPVRTGADDRGEQVHRWRAEESGDDHHRDGLLLQDDQEAVQQPEVWFGAGTGKDQHHLVGVGEQNLTVSVMHPA